MQTFAWPAQVLGLLAGVVIGVAPTHNAPAATYYVAPGGDDANDGSRSQPFRTVQRGAEAAHAGDVVLVGRGVYRERVSPPRGGTAGKPIIFRAAVRHQAVIKGSDLVSGMWQTEAEGIWSTSIDQSLFTDTTHVDGGQVFEIGLSSTPRGREGRPEYQRSLRDERGGNADANPEMVYTLGQVFLESAVLDQVPFREELSQQADSWWYDRDEQRLFVHPSDGKSPADRQVEITTRRRIFAPHLRGLGYIHVEGFVFEHCGNQYPTDFWMEEKPQHQQAGAVGTRSGHHWVIRHNVIRLAKTVGLDLGLEGHPETDLETGGQQRRSSCGFHVVEDNWILDNGGAGTASYQGTALTLRRNVVIGNNRLGFTGTKRWESGGIKLHRPKRSVIEDNLVAFNDHWGIWLDQGPGQETRICRNIVIGHGVGIDFEAGGDDAAVAANNLLMDNRVGICFREAGGVLVAHNLIAGSRTGIEVRVGGGRTGNWTRGNIPVVGNLISADETVIAMTAADFDRSSGRRFAGNLYLASAAEPSWKVFGTKPMPFADWQSFWRQQVAEADSDSSSLAVTGVEIACDPWALELKVIVPAGLELPRPPPLTGLEADFFGQTSGSPRIAGPLASLPSGVSHHRLWSRPLPWRR